MGTNIFNLFKASVDKYGDRVALVIDNQDYTYSELFLKSNQLSLILKQFEHTRVGIFASRSLPAYTGILGTLVSGKTYVPLNPKFPALRNKAIIDLAGLEVFVIDKTGLDSISLLKDYIKPGAVLIFPDRDLEDVPALISEKFKVFTAIDLKDISNDPGVADTNVLAYIMFTSGSTGIPKGVPVTHTNVLDYINYLRNRYELGPEDKFSQTFDLTFDLSVHDLFLSWSVGASLYVIPENELMAPARFLKRNKLTVWFSVPSLAQFMKRFKMLKENTFPELRYSLFCGEPLPKTIANAWQVAAPNSILENIYGPTEATIGITHYRIPFDQDKIAQHNGVIAIGEIFHTQNYCLINEKNDRVTGTGELCISGSQLTSGYWNNPEKTSEAYFRFSSDDTVWYKTGDIVKLENNNLFYVSRKDFQVKIRGYRIELEEINLAIQEYSKSEIVRTLPYPVIDGVADNLYSFVINDCNGDKADIISHLKNKLPVYMVPKDVIFIKDFPLNINGKIDTNQLIKYINNK